MSAFLKPNEVLANKYRVIRQIGSGGTALIYDAINLANGEKVAIKISKDDNKVSSGIERFRNEYKLLSRFNNPNIIKVLDYIVGSNYEAMVIEHVDGQTLKQLIRSKGVMSINNSVHYVKQILSSLNDIHSKNIYHRDLKPQNVMIAYSGAVKLLDFGIAKHDAEDGVTKTGKVVGSVQYISPEILTGDKPSFESDIYAVGMILFELLTGETAYKGTNPAQVAGQIVNTPLPDIRKKNGTVDDSLASIVNKSLSKKPDDRYTSVAEMAEDLIRWENRVKTLAEDEKEYKERSSKSHFTAQYSIYKKSKFRLVSLVFFALIVLVAIVVLVIIMV